MQVGLDGRALQRGFKRHLGRGIGLYAQELVRALARCGEAELTLFLDPRYPGPEAALPAAVRLASYPRQGWPRKLHDLAATQSGVASTVGRARLDVFHFLAHGDAPLRMPGHVVVTVHDLIPFLMRRLYAPEKPLRYALARAIERAVIRRAPFIVTDSETSRRDLVERMGVDGGQIRVCPLGVDARFRPQPAPAVAALKDELGLARPYVLYVGGLDARKNGPGLVAAWARLGARAEAPDLVLAGAGADAPETVALRRQAARLGVGPRLRTLGFVPDQALPALLTGAEVFVFPSLYEGFGLPPLEAMACGTPVVATAAGSLPEVLGEAALLVPPADEEALAAALARVLGDRDLGAALGARGRERAARYTWAATAQATLEAYREARASRR